MNSKKHKLLVVEDEAPAALALASALEAEGYEVYQAGDGEEGLQIALEKHPDMILTDLRMPKMSGMDMIKEIRKDEWGKGARIIILTNVSEMASLEDAMKNDTYYYLIKSDSSVADVIEAVERQLAKH